MHIHELRLQWSPILWAQFTRDSSLNSYVQSIPKLGRLSLLDLVAVCLSVNKTEPTDFSLWSWAWIEIRVKK